MKKSKQGRIIENVNAISNDLIEINKYSSKALTDSDVLCIEIRACDNEIDRDNEYFSYKSLIDISKNITGKPLILNHDWKSENQVGRIYESSVITTPNQLTKSGEIYSYVKCKAYIPKGKVALVDDIESGIKKEMSIGCNIEKFVCNQCKNQWLSNVCDHIKSTVILDGVADVYELSFVAVPAQQSAGIIKNQLIKNKIYKNVIRSQIHE